MGACRWRRRAGCDRRGTGTAEMARSLGATQVCSPGEEAETVMREGAKGLAAALEDLGKGAASEVKILFDPTSTW